MAVNELSTPLTPQQQKRLSIELYGLLGSQVKSYHAHYHMGENSSVPTEVAQELLESIRYTLDAAGGYLPGEPIEGQLARGQVALEKELAETEELFRLVRATAPEWQSQCRWEALEHMGRFLRKYDVRHFAHRGPGEPDYPLLWQLPDLRGIQYAKAYLHCLWLENQILDALPGAEGLLELAPPGYWEAPQNLCEQPLWNAMAKALTGADLEPLWLSDGERGALAGDVRERLDWAMTQVCDALRLPADLRQYAHGAVTSLRPRLNAANGNALFW